MVTKSKLIYRVISSIRLVCLTLVLICLCLLDLSFLPLGISSSYGADDRFSNYEIRVIRPRFFQKRQRVEAGGGLLMVTNDTYVHTLMASGLLSYHFTESLALEAAAAIGTSLDKQEKSILVDDFDIKTEVFRTLYFFEGSILYTPVYGKVQLPKGRLVYFDTFLSLGAGMTGVQWQYSDMCQEPNFERNPNAEPVPADSVKSYPTLAYGIGQRIFRNRKTAFRWELKGHSVFYDTADSACNSTAAANSESATHNNITLQIGASQFF